MKHHWQDSNDAIRRTEEKKTADESNETRNKTSDTLRIVRPKCRTNIKLDEQSTSQDTSKGNF